MTTQTGSISFESTKGLQSYAKQNYSTLAQTIGQFAKCKTGASSTNKVVTIEGDSSTWNNISSGTTITVQFSSANSATAPTLNVNNNGAKLITDSEGNVLTQSKYQWAENAVIAFTYDASGNGGNGVWKMRDDNLMERVHIAETEIDQTANNVLIRATKNISTNSGAGQELIESFINVAPDNIKIDASQVDIEGAAIFKSGGAYDKSTTIVKTETQWYSSTNPTTKTGGSWRTSQPEVTAGRYIWQRELVTYASGSTAYKPSEAGVCIQGQTDLSGYSTTTQMNTTIEDAVNGIEIGGRNLLLNSGDLTLWNKESGISVAWDSTVGMYKMTDSYHTSSRWGILQNVTITEPGYYTCSVDAMSMDSSHVVGLGFGVYSSNSTWPASLASTKETRTRITATIDVPEGTTTLRVYLNLIPVAKGDYVYFYHPKLEKGNKATDWSPAPEDVDADIATAQMIANDAQTKANAAAPKADAIKRTQRIYYRSDTSGTPPSAPVSEASASSKWVTSSAMTWNSGNSITTINSSNDSANGGWTTNPGRLTVSSTPTNKDKQYIYLYTCIQKETVAGAVTCDTVLIDATDTVIDGGKIVTGSVTANQIDATDLHVNAINIDGTITFGQLSGVQASGDYALTSNIPTKVSDLTNDSGFQTSSDVNTIIDGKGYATQTNLTTEINQRKAQYGTCSVSASTPQKDVTCANFELIAGNEITVKFSNANIIAAPTLNVNNKGAKNIWVANAITSSSNQLLWGANAYITFRYDGFQFIVEGEPRTWYGVSDTAANVATKTDTTTIVGCVICKGTKVELAMKYNNTTNSPALNIAGTGAKNLYYGNGEIRPTYANGTSWLGESTHTFTFDGQYWRCAGKTYLDANSIVTGEISADRMSSKVIDAINASIDIIDAERIQTSAITIGKSQVEGLTGDLNTINQQISGITGDLEDLDNKIDHINDDRNLVWKSNQFKVGAVSSTSTMTPTLDDGWYKITLNASSATNRTSTNWWATGFAADTDDIKNILASGTEYTVSLIMMVESGATTPPQIKLDNTGFHQLWNGNNGNLQANKWITVSCTFTFTPSSSIIYPTLQWGTGAGVYYIKAWKIEKGNQATAWSLAPDDLELRSDYSYIKHSSPIYAKQNNTIPAGRLIVGTNLGYQSIASGVIFNLSYPILYAAEEIIQETTSGEIYEAYPGINFSANSTNNFSGSINSIVYLKGTVNGNLFTIEDITTQTSSTLDHKFYIPLGILSESTTRGYFTSSKDLYAFVGDSSTGKFRQATPSEIVATHRIYYRSKTNIDNSNNTKPAIPTRWITKTENIYNTDVATGDNGWSTKITPMAADVDSEKYIYLYTCEQRQRLDDTLEHTEILLDDSTTIIDGGNIVTGSIDANKINATSINASSILTVGAFRPTQINDDGQIYSSLCPVSLNLWTKYLYSDNISNSKIEWNNVENMWELKSNYNSKTTIRVYYKVLLEPNTIYTFSVLTKAGDVAAKIAYSNSNSDSDNGALNYQQENNSTELIEKTYTFTTSSSNLYYVFTLYLSRSTSSTSTWNNCYFAEPKLFKGIPLANSAASTVKTTQQYYLSTYENSLAGGSWQNTIEWTTGKYIWTRNKIVKITLDGDESSPTYAPSENGVYDKQLTTALSTAASAQTAANSAASTVTITKEYYLSTAENSLAGDTWKSDVPTWSNGKYIWTRFKIVKTPVNGTTSTTYIPENGSYDKPLTTALANASAANSEEIVLYYASSSATNIPSKPTISNYSNGVTTNSATAYGQWNKALPSYSTSYPYLYTCFQRKTVGGTYSWTDVIQSSYTAWTERIHADMINESQRIYYRSKVAINNFNKTTNLENAAGSTATKWVTCENATWNDDDTTQSIINGSNDTGWSRVPGRLTINVDGSGDTNADGGGDTYPYLYTCVQHKTVGNAVTCTSILIDENNTIIDGGQIITGSVTANQLNVNDINGSGIISLGALQNDIPEQILNSEIVMGKKEKNNLIINDLDLWNKLNSTITVSYDNEIDMWKIKSSTTSSPYSYGIAYNIQLEPDTVYTLNVSGQAGGVTAKASYTLKTDSTVSYSATNDNIQTISAEEEIKELTWTFITGDNTSSRYINIFLYFTTTTTAANNYCYFTKPNLWVGTEQNYNLYLNDTKQSILDTNDIVQSSIQSLLDTRDIIKSSIELDPTINSIRVGYKNNENQYIGYHTEQKDDGYYINNAEGKPVSQYLSNKIILGKDTDLLHLELSSENGLEFISSYLDNNNYINETISQYTNNLIILGNKNSSNGSYLEIQPTKLTFVLNNNEQTSIGLETENSVLTGITPSNEWTLFSKNIRIQNSLRFNNFTWITRNNGNMSLKWLGQ